MYFNLCTYFSLYQFEIQPQIQKLYPKVEFPVSRGTPMISSKIKWKHDVEHFVPSFECNLEKKDAMIFKINLLEEEWAALDGHVVDGKSCYCKIYFNFVKSLIYYYFKLQNNPLLLGRNLFPATGYLYLAWAVLAELLAVDLGKLKVVFENCKFVRACTIPKPSASNSLELQVMMQEQSGNFEIIGKCIHCMPYLKKISYKYIFRG